MLVQFALLSCFFKRFALYSWLGKPADSFSRNANG